MCCLCQSILADWQHSNALIGILHSLIWNYALQFLRGSHRVVIFPSSQRYMVGALLELRLSLGLCFWNSIQSQALLVLVEIYFFLDFWIIYPVLYKHEDECIDLVHNYGSILLSVFGFSPSFLRFLRFFLQAQAIQVIHRSLQISCSSGWFQLLIDS